MRRDRSPDAPAYRCERESGSLQSESHARVPCGDRGRPLADGELHRKWPISLINRHFRKNFSSAWRQSEQPLGRLAAYESGACQSDQESNGSEAQAEKINFDCNWDKKGYNNRNLRFSGIHSERLLI